MKKLAARGLVALPERCPLQAGSATGATLDVLWRYLMATSVRVVNASRVSEGNSMSFLPVAAAPAVPAPAPAAAPIAAPLPPPARAPINAPAPAPPPMNSASRLPLPPIVLPAELVVSE